MLFEKKIFEGAKECLSIKNGSVELIVSSSFGPRVLFYGFEGGRNFFQVFKSQIANFNVDEWQIYGGHRLWIAPEECPKSYYPDNHSIEYTWDKDTLFLTAPIEITNGIQKSIEIKMEENSTKVEINHIITNVSNRDIRLSAWALSVMNSEGRAIIPQEDYKPHPECLLPARPVVLWHFTNMADTRFTWGRKYIQIAQNDEYTEKLKIGVLNKKGKSAYILHDEVFIKTHDFIEDEEYPDMGCNEEFFTMPKFLEMETLSPLKTLKPKDVLEHKETWMIKNIEVSSSEKDLDKIFA